MILHPFLFALFPILFLFSKNAASVSLSGLPTPIGLVLSAAGLFWFALTLVLRDKRRSALLTSLSLALFFFYGHALTLLLGTQLGPLKVSGQKDLLVYWGILFLAGAWVILRLKNLGGVTRYLNAMSVILLVIAGGTGFWSFFISSRVTEAPSSWEEILELPAEDLPDIYYIVLDGYGRADTLQKYYGHDNSPFIRWLTERGFYVAHRSRPNYTLTSPSLASSMNMDYLDRLVERVGPHSRNEIPLQRRIRNGAVMNFLRQRGYSIVAFSSGFYPTEMRDADAYLAPPIGFSPFQNELINSTPIQALPRLLDLFDLQRRSHAERILFTLDRLPATTRLSSPRFVFAHIVCPHPPYLFRADGTRLPATNRRFSFEPRKDMAYEEYRENYAAQLAFVTGRIQSAIDRILRDSRKPPVILLQADHGPAFYSRMEPDRYAEERLAILNAYYFPDRNYAALHEGITPVNSFRIVFNQYLGTRAPLLEDRSYLNNQRGLYDFHEVTFPEKGKDA